MNSAIEDHPYFLKFRENDTKAPCADTCQHGETEVLNATLLFWGILVVHSLWGFIYVHSFMGIPVGLCSQG